MSCYTLILFLSIISIGYAKIIQTSYCDRPHNRGCVIHQVDLEPCELLGIDTICTMRKNAQVYIKMTYTPKFGTENLITGVDAIYDSKAVDIVPRENGCLHTQCPIESREKNNYTMSFILPEDEYADPAHFIVYMMGESSTQVCCTTFAIKQVD